MIPRANPLSVDGSVSAGLDNAPDMSPGNWTYSGKTTASGLHLALAALRTNRDGRLFANPHGEDHPERERAQRSEFSERGVLRDGRKFFR